MSTVQTLPPSQGETMASVPSFQGDVAAIPDDMLYEVVDGRILEKKMSARETEIASLLVGLLTPLLRTNRLGKVVAEMLFRLDQVKDRRRRPDVAFVSKARWPYARRIPKVTPWDMVPDLAIEVISETNSAYGVQEKIHEYFAAGVSQVWVIYPDQAEVYVYSTPKQVQVLGAGQELDGGELLPGFRLPVATLFEDDPE